MKVKAKGVEKSEGEKRPETELTSVGFSGRWGTRAVAPVVVVVLTKED